MHIDTHTHTHTHTRTHAPVGLKDGEADEDGKVVGQQHATGPDGFPDAVHLPSHNGLEDEPC